jgi:hypothetical protein
MIITVEKLCWNPCPLPKAIGCWEIHVMIGPLKRAQTYHSFVHHAEDIVTRSEYCNKINYFFVSVLECSKCGFTQS